MMNLWCCRRTGVAEGPNRIVPLHSRLVGTSTSSSSAPATIFEKNDVRTAKFTPLSFVPLLLFEQFQRLANIYFLLISAIQLATTLSPTNKYSTIIPLIAVLTVSAIREAFEDLARHRSDRQVNSAPVQVLRNLPSTGSTSTSTSATPHVYGWVTVKCADVNVGDLIQVKSNEVMPADTVLLTSGGTGGGAYVDTASLDGETNLKAKTALAPTSKIGLDIDALAALRGTVACDHPNSRLHAFSGLLEITSPTTTTTSAGSIDAGIQSVPATNDHLLLRGMVVRNTPWAVGVVVYGGHSSKVMLNARDPPRKRSKIDHLIDRLVMFIFLLLAALCTVSAVASKVWTTNVGSGALSYLPFLDSSDQASFEVWITSLLLFNNLLPISLYVTLELAQFVQAIWINTDPTMTYIIPRPGSSVPSADINSDTEKNDDNKKGKSLTTSSKSDQIDGIKMPARARTSTLNPSLGMVKVIVTDKTGTLTQNVMTLRTLTIGGTAFGSLPGTGATQASAAAGAVSISPAFDGAKLKEEMMFPTSSASAAAAASTSSSGGERAMYHSDPRVGFTDPSLLQALENNAHPRHQQAVQSVLTMALCHGVQVNSSNLKKSLQINNQGDSSSLIPAFTTADVMALEYQSASPDEVALVQAARALGYALVARDETTMTLQIFGKPTVDIYEILAVNEFNSTRKRMSVLLKGPDGEVFLLVKGADSSMIPKITNAVPVFSADGGKPAAGSNAAASSSSGSSESQSNRGLNSTGRSGRRTSAAAGAPLGGLSTPGSRYNVLQGAMAASAERSSGASSSLPANSPATDAAAIATGLVLNDDQYTARNSDSVAYPTPTIYRSRTCTDTGSAHPTTATNDIVPKRVHTGGIIPPLPIYGGRTGNSKHQHTYTADTNVLGGGGGGGFDNASGGLRQDELSALTVLQTHLDSFASSGLRTLVLARRDCDINTTEILVAKHQAASRTIVGREEALEEVAEEMEMNLGLAGATGIEDRLQDGVPATISSLSSAGIRFVVCTGDKTETAINIGLSCSLLSEECDLVVLKSLDRDINAASLAAARQSLQDRGLWRPGVVNSSLSLVIEGHALHALLDKSDLQKDGAQNSEEEDKEEEGETENENKTGPADQTAKGSSSKITAAGSNDSGAAAGGELADHTISWGAGKSKTKASHRTVTDRRRSSVMMVASKMSSTISRSIKNWFRNLSKNVTDFLVSMLPTVSLDGIEATSGIKGTTAFLRGARRQGKSNLSSIEQELHIEAASRNSDVIRAELVEFMQQCRSVICSRVSPLQKAEVVRLVQAGSTPRPLVLAVGDGGNDVNMIQSADIGVGIAGLEGQQAVMASDYAIGQFKFLAPLLLVHGRLNYQRVVLAVCYCVYKNVALVLTLWGYTFWNGFSGTTLYESYLGSMWNLLFTSLPVISAACADFDIPAAAALAYPLVYTPGQRNAKFNTSQVALWLLEASLHALVVGLLGSNLLGRNTDGADGTDDGLMLGGTGMHAFLLFTVTAKLALEIHSWAWHTVASFAVSIALWFGFVGAYSQVFAFLPIAAVSDIYGISNALFVRPSFWLLLPIIPLAALIFDILLHYVRRALLPDVTTVVQEWAAGYGSKVSLAALTAASGMSAGAIQPKSSKASSSTHDYAGGRGSMITGHNQMGVAGRHDRTRSMMASGTTAAVTMSHRSVSGANIDTGRRHSIIYASSAGLALAEGSGGMGGGGAGVESGNGISVVRAGVTGMVIDSDAQAAYLRLAPIQQENVMSEEEHARLCSSLQSLTRRVRAETIRKEQTHQNKLRRAAAAAIMAARYMGTIQHHEEPQIAGVGSTTSGGGGGGGGSGTIEGGGVTTASEKPSLARAFLASSSADTKNKKLVGPIAQNDETRTNFPRDLLSGENSNSDLQASSQSPTGALTNQTSPTRLSQITNRSDSRSNLNISISQHPPVSHIDADADGDTSAHVPRERRLSARFRDFLTNVGSSMPFLNADNSASGRHVMPRNPSSLSLTGKSFTVGNSNGLLSPIAGSPNAATSADKSNSSRTGISSGSARSPGPQQQQSSAHDDNEGGGTVYFEEQQPQQQQQTKQTKGVNQQQNSITDLSTEPRPTLGGKNKNPSGASTTTNPGTSVAATAATSTSPPNKPSAASPTGDHKHHQAGGGGAVAPVAASEAASAAEEEALGLWDEDEDDLDEDFEGSSVAMIHSDALGDIRSEGGSIHPGTDASSGKNASPHHGRGAGGPAHPNTGSSAYNRFTHKFADPAREKLFFRNFFVRKSIRLMRLAVAVAAIFALAYLLLELDRSDLPQLIVRSLLVGGGFGFLIFTCFGVFREPGMYSGAMLTAIMLSGAAKTLVIDSDGLFGQTLFQMGILLVLRMRFIHALFAAAVDLAIFIGFSALNPRSTVILPVFVVYILFSSTFGAVSAWTLHVAMREDFLSESRLYVEEKRGFEMVSAMLPPHVVSTLRKLTAASGDWAGLVSDAEPCVTIVFIDILDFVGLTSYTTPQMLVSLLDRLWAMFDALAEKHAITKLETVGKEYVACAGLHHDRRDHASACVAFATDVLRVLSLVRSADGKQALQVRIGVNTGPVIAGILGHVRPQFVLVGDTTNVSSRMSSSGLDGFVNISPSTYERVRFKFVCVPRVVDVKSKGKMTVYYVIGKMTKTAGRRASLASLPRPPIVAVVPEAAPTSSDITAALMDTTGVGDTSAASVAAPTPSAPPATDSIATSSNTTASTAAHHTSHEVSPASKVKSGTTGASSGAAPLPPSTGDSSDELNIDPNEAIIRRAAQRKQLEEERMSARRQRRDKEVSLHSVTYRFNDRSLEDRWQLATARGVIPGVRRAVMVLAFFQIFRLAEVALRYQVTHEAYSRTTRPSDEETGVRLAYTAALVLFYMLTRTYWYKSALDMFPDTSSASLAGSSSSSSSSSGSSHRDHMSGTTTVGGAYDHNEPPPPVRISWQGGLGHRFRLWVRLYGHGFLLACGGFLMSFASYSTRDACLDFIFYFSVISNSQTLSFITASAINIASAGFFIAVALMSGLYKDDTGDPAYSPLNTVEVFFLVAGLAMCALAQGAVEFYRRHRFAVAFLFSSEVGKNQALLHRMLPAAVVEQLMDGGGTHTAQSYTDVCILFCDVAGFTKMSAEISPVDVISMLNKMFAGFEAAAAINGAFKVQTIGDCFVCVTGMPYIDDPPDVADSYRIGVTDHNLKEDDDDIDGGGNVALLGNNNNEDESNHKYNAATSTYATPMKNANDNNKSAPGSTGSAMTYVSTPGSALSPSGGAMISPYNGGQNNSSIKSPSTIRSMFSFNRKSTAKIVPLPTPSATPQSSSSSSSSSKANMSGGSGLISSSEVAPFPELSWPCFSELAHATLPPQTIYAASMLRTAVSFIDVVRHVRNPKTGGAVLTRIGLHTGDVVGGVIGTRSFRYDTWGADVLAANAMESAGVPGGILVSETTAYALNIMQASPWALPGLKLIPSTDVTVKGRGTLATYLVHIDGLPLVCVRPAEA